MTASATKKPMGKKEIPHVGLKKRVGLKPTAPPPPPPPPPSSSLSEPDTSPPPSLEDSSSSLPSLDAVEAAVAPAKTQKRRFKNAVIMERTIKRERKSGKTAINRRAFDRLVRAAVNNVAIQLAHETDSLPLSFKLSPNALRVIHLGTEKYIMTHMEAQTLLVHNKNQKTASVMNAETIMKMHRIMRNFDDLGGAAHVSAKTLVDSERQERASRRASAV